jgi:ParB family chromosome partitioning protein
MRRALGKGLEALLPQPATAPAGAARGTEAPGPTRVSVQAIRPNPNQPRRHFEPEALAALSASIRDHGVLQPLLVRPAGDGYELIAGERRLRAAVAAGLAEVPIVVREADPRERMELALIENLQREDLSPLEEAAAYRQLIDEFGLTQDELSGRVGKSRPAIANSLRLLSLPDAVKAQLASGELSAGHARAVLSVEADTQVAFARELIENKVPKSEAERLAASRRPKGRGRRAGRAARAGLALDPNWRAAAEGLTRALGTRVRLGKRGRGGTIEIEFYSDAELDRLLVVLTRSSSR